MKTYVGEKHKKSEKQDGHKAWEDRTKGDKKTPPRFENFNGKPTE